MKSTNNAFHSLVSRFFRKSRFSRPSIIIAGFYLLVTFYRLAIHGFDPFSFFNTGTVVYDGLAYYNIALDPLNNLKLSNSYRHQRILYPLLARCIALGNPQWIPSAMIVIDFASVLIATEMVALIMTKYGKPPYYSLLYGLYVGQLLSYSLVLAEPLMCMLVAVGVYGSLVNRWKLAASAFILAVFTKESAILFTVGYAVWFIIKRDLTRTLKLILVAIVPFAIFQIILRVWFGEFAFFAQPTLQWTPFYGMYFFRSSPMNFLKIICVILIPILAGIYFVWKGPFNQIILYILFNGLFMIFLTPDAYHDIAAFSRTAIGLNIALLCYASARKKNSILNLLAIWTLPFSLWFIQRLPKM